MSEGSALVVGGTGMLAAATHWVAQRHRPTVVVGRRASSFTGGEAGYRPLDADWADPALDVRLSEALADLPPPTTALLWLHDPDSLLGVLTPHLASARRVVLVLGSMDGRPAVPDLAAGMTTVRLGSKPGLTGRRWLTNQEIADAAIEALQDGESRQVGDPEPV